MCKSKLHFDFNASNVMDFGERYFIVNSNLNSLIKPKKIEFKILNSNLYSDFL